MEDRTSPVSRGRGVMASLSGVAFALGLGALAVGAWTGGAGVSAKQKDVTVSFKGPLDGEYISGPVPIRLEIDPPGTPIRIVNVFADGKLVCALEQPPFECEWDAGQQVKEHALRAVVVLPDGNRVGRGIRTRGVAHTETTDVDVVHITASVTDRDAAFVKGLRRQQFRVLENDVPQEVTYFAAENIPLEIIVAVDVSGSMTDAMPELKKATRAFLSALRPNDSVTLIGFNDNLFTLARPGADMASRLRAVDRLAPWGGTALYDAIVRSVDQLGKRSGRRVLVLFTDGEDRDSHVAPRVAEERLEASDVVLYSIGQGRAADTRSLKEILERLADKTGGRAFFEDVARLEGVFGHILEELSNQYLLGYVPKNGARDGAWRRVDVRVSDPKMRVRARKGYRLMPR